MGCHTWFYKKTDTPPYEEMKKFVVDTYKRSVNDLTRWIDNPTDAEYLEMVAVYTDWTIEAITNWRDADARRVRMIEAGLCKQAVMNKFCMYGDGLKEFYNGNLYDDVDGYHDLFRKYGYPEDRLFSLEETLEYINDPKNECQTYDKTVERLTKFWTENPDGMITFG
jgi:hypothetical protein